VSGRQTDTRRNPNQPTEHQCGYAHGSRRGFRVRPDRPAQVETRQPARTGPSPFVSQGCPAWPLRPLAPTVHGRMAGPLFLSCVSKRQKIISVPTVAGFRIKLTGRPWLLWVCRSRHCNSSTTLTPQTTPGFASFLPRHRHTRSLGPAKLARLRRIFALASAAVPKQKEEEWSCNHTL
jgi:hypothetical protein